MAQRLASNKLWQVLSAAALNQSSGQGLLAVAAHDTPWREAALRCMSAASTSTGTKPVGSATSAAVPGPSHGSAAAPNAASASTSSAAAQQQAETEQPQPGASNSASSSPTPEEMAKSFYESLRSGFDAAKAKVGAGASSSSSSTGGGGGSSSGDSESRAGEGARGAAGEGAGPAPGEGAQVSGLKGLLSEVSATLLPQQDVRSATRMYTGPLMPEGAAGGPSELLIVKRKPTAWQKAWDAAAERFPFLSGLKTVKVQETAAYKKGAEVAEDLRERWETSDHPAVHKVEDYKERFFAGSETSRAMREIRTRDPGFDLNAFVKSVKKDGPPVVKAFLRHDLESLRLHCGPELIERFSGIFKHFQEQGLVEDPTILYTGDVEIVEVRLVDNDPWIIAQFNCYQLKCTRDRFGNVVEGSPDTIQRVYYFWGLQQERQGVVTAEGEVLPPRWVVKDMMWQSVLALV